MTGFPLRLNPAAASQYLKEIWGIEMAAKTLRNRTCLGAGPQWAYWGCRPYTTTALLDHWVEANFADEPANKPPLKRREGNHAAPGMGAARNSRSASLSEDQSTEPANSAGTIGVE